jgi:hypothetical protein
MLRNTSLRHGRSEVWRTVYIRNCLNFRNRALCNKPDGTVWCVWIFSSSSAIRDRAGKSPIYSCWALNLQEYVSSSCRYSAWIYPLKRDQGRGTVPWSCLIEHQVPNIGTSWIIFSYSSVIQKQYSGWLSLYRPVVLTEGVERKSKLFLKT